jgi:hexosaminidase
MYDRLTLMSQRLDWRGVTHRSSYNPMLERLADGSPITDLQVLVDAVEPLGIDVRERARRYSQATPFNRVVDTARGESLPLRQLEFEIHRLGKSAPSSGDWSHVKRVLQSWKENDQRLSPLIRERFLLLEAAPLSRDLAEVGGIGLNALQFIQSGHPASADWVEQQTRRLASIQRPQAEITLAAARSARLLVDIAAGKTDRNSKIADVNHFRYGTKPLALV